MAGNNPQAAGGFRLPPWAATRLDLTFPEGEEPRFESPSYPIINMLLNGIFNPNDRYMIAPQLVLVKTPQVDPDTSITAAYGSGTSSSESEANELDNFGEVIPNRKSGRIKKGSSTNPDFVIVKANISGSISNDWLCGLVEIKKSTRDATKSRHQLRKYLDVVLSKTGGNVSNDFRAYLVLDRDVTEVYELDQSMLHRSQPSRTISTVEHTGFTQDLQALSRICQPL